MPKQLVVLIDENCDECLYVDGVAWEPTGETTVYACDIAEAAGNGEVTISHESIDFSHKAWPKLLKDAQREQH